jgi:hypothetical protein
MSAPALARTAAPGATFGMRRRRARSVRDSPALGGLTATLLVRRPGIIDHLLGSSATRAARRWCAVRSAAVGSDRPPVSRGR